MMPKSSEPAKRSMFFLCRLHQWERLKQGVGLPTGAVVASADYDLTQKLRSIGMDVVDLFTFATEQITRQSVDQAWSVAAALRRNAPAEADLDGCNLVERTANEIVFPWNEVFFQRALIDACLTQYLPQRVYGFPEMEQSYEWDFPVDQPTDVFNATVAYCAAAQGIRYCAVSALAQSVEPVKQQTPQIQPVPNARLESSQVAGYRTICFAPKFAGLREMRTLISAISKEGRTDWLVVTDSDEPLGLPTLRQELLLGLPFDSPSWSQRDVEVQRCILLNCLAGQVDDSIGRMLHDTLFSFIWHHYAARQADWARWYRAATFLAASTNVSAVIVGYDVLAVHRIIEAAFARHAIPTLSIDHVGCGVDASHRRNIGATAHVAVWGEADRLGNERWRAPHWQVIEVGTLRADHAALEIALMHGADSSPPRHSATRSCRRPRIVLFTSKFATSRTVTGTISAFERSWSNLLTLIERRSDWDFVLKPHPGYDHYALYNTSRYLLPNLQVINNGTDLADVSAQDVLIAADVAILVNCASTTAVDAVGLGIPVLYLNDASWAGQKSPIEGVLVSNIVSFSNLEVEINRLLSDATHHAQTIQSSNLALSKIVVAANHGAVRRVKSAIETLRKPIASVKQESTFGSYIVELLVTSIIRPDNFLRWSRRTRAYVTENAGLEAQLLMLTLPSLPELKPWIWTIVISRCQRTKTTLRASVFFAVAYAYLPTVWHIRVREIPSYWHLFRSRRSKSLVKTPPVKKS